MKLVIWIVCGVLALGIAVTAVGWWLPIAHHASRAAIIGASPERVYALISEVEHIPVLVERYHARGVVAA